MQELKEYQSLKPQRNYKEMYLQMREINKDLKSHFRKLSDKVSDLISFTAHDQEDQENSANNL